MEYIIHVAFDFDDDAVKKKLENTVENDVKKAELNFDPGESYHIYYNVQQYVVDAVFDREWNHKHADPERDPLQGWVRKYIKELVSEYKDEIVKQAALELADSMKRSTTFRQKLLEEVKEKL